MAITLLKMKEGETVPKIPEWLRGKFFELHKEVTYSIDEDCSYEDFEYAGWLHIKDDGTIEIGEPGA